MYAIRRWSVRQARGMASRRMKNGAVIDRVGVPVDRAPEGTSSWLRIVRLKPEGKRKDAA